MLDGNGADGGLLNSSFDKVRKQYFYDTGYHLICTDVVSVLVKKYIDGGFDLLKLHSGQ